MGEFRLKPNDTEAEAIVIGALLGMPRDDEAVFKVLDTLAPEDFFLLKHGKVFEAIKRVWQDVRWADRKLVSDELRNEAFADQRDEILTKCSLASNEMRNTFNVVAYAKRIAELADRRRIIAAGEAAASTAADESIPIEEVRTTASSGIVDASIKRTDNHNVTAWETTEGLFLELQSGVEVGARTGFRDLDRHFRKGLVPGQYWILAGRPAMGKSAFALRIANNITSGKAMPDRMPGVVLYISLEMSEEDNQVRLVSESLNTAINEVYDLNPQHDKWEQFRQTCDVVGRLPIIYNTRADTIDSIRAAYRRCLMDAGRCDAIIVDREDLMLSNGEVAGTENRLLTAVSAGLLKLSKDVPVLALAQLSRKVEERASKEPLLSDLRMSGSLEQDATAVLMMYRAHYYDENADPNGATVFIRKNRQGSTGRVELFFKPELTAFYDMVWEKEQN